MLLYKKESHVSLANYQTVPYSAIQYYIPPYIWSSITVI